MRADGGVMETARDSSVVRVEGAVDVERESAAGAVAITGATVHRRDGSQTVIAHGGGGCSGSEASGYVPIAEKGCN